MTNLAVMENPDTPVSIKTYESVEVAIKELAPDLDLDKQQAMTLGMLLILSLPPDQQEFFTMIFSRARIYSRRTGDSIVAAFKRFLEDAQRKAEDETGPAVASVIAKGPGKGRGTSAQGQ